ncbi:MAG: RsmB/NOP family class I SAM-dependent RNA methyltransferase [Deltaproteobacteria bacterium]|nr:RsmB/NOP family class I SAM-dependent RNA methyltransferase [Deltaproteobacteria bacterium]MBW2342697.1 RsmB/NOP family class I SAM-dependent RNA methyltransferase [Deltaproteobacteria bacterium]
MKPIFERYQEIIPDFSLFQESLHNPFPTHLRVNLIKAEPVLVVDSLEAKGIHLKSATGKNNSLYLAPELNSSGNLLEYFLGHIHPQALTSCLASIALGPEQGAYVLDMCASPGGKTSHLAELMHNTGFIVANELYPKRQIPLGHTLERLGVLNAVITGYQAQEFPMKHRFDYILADVPCSGEGRFRQTKKDFTYRETGTKAKLSDLQKKIMLRGFDLLKKNGEMLYSTCTYNPEENESVVNLLLDNRDAKLLPIHVGLDYDPGLIKWGNKNYDKQLERTARFYPHRIDSVGFFMARIGRRN